MMMAHEIEAFTHHNMHSKIKSWLDVMDIAPEDFLYEYISKKEFDRFLDGLYEIGRYRYNDDIKEYMKYFS